MEGTDMQQGTAPCAGGKSRDTEMSAVAAYMRVSTAEQRRRYGIPAQADAIRTFMEERLQHSRVIAAAMRQLEADKGALERVLAHARDWPDELEARVSRDGRLAAVLGATAPDSRSLLPSEQRCLIESLDLRVDIADPEFRYREGTKCLTMQWHERTGTLVPPDPTDIVWARVEEFLRSRYRPHHFRSPLDLRAALTGMLHRLRTGLMWRDLPECFGDLRKVRLRQRTWLADGVWAEIVGILSEEGEGALC